jgi:DNA mismatch repair protein MutL
MEGKINVLDEKVISQIAAGEVIERPASVVKELVENAIDARADKITIKIEDGGKRSIKITDDGTGITKDDVKLAFLRHSTSKITTLRDLESISSLGFRGEALASIAAVSKVTLITKFRRSEDKAGCEIVIEGGKIKHIGDQAANYGTTVMVKDLFYNTPARRKFLKSSRAELAKITDIVTRFALIHPGIFFKLEHNGSEILSSPKAESFLDNIAFIYGNDIAREMLEVSYSDSDLKIKGYISKPGVFRKTASHISIFVNQRYITSKLLTSALKEGYHNLIMKNRFPIAVISLTVHPRKLDVNVHPTKLEIKFQEEKKVYSGLANAVRSTLETKSLIPSVGDMTIEAPKLEAFEIDRLDTISLLGDILPVVEAKSQANIEAFEPGAVSNMPQESQVDYSKTKIPRMAVIGQILHTYIVAESGDNILIIDQHAAHERVLFERLKAKDICHEKR